MGHFRAPAPANYLKAGNPSGQHPSDASKSPSNNQDVLSVFTTGTLPHSVISNFFCENLKRKLKINVIC